MVTTILIASGALLIANSNASAARVSGKWCENNAATAVRLAATSFIASRKSAAVAQLEPMTSISFSGKASGLTGAVPDDMPTTTTRPAAATSSAAWGRTPASPLVSTTSGGPSVLVQSRTCSSDLVTAASTDGPFLAAANKSVIGGETGHYRTLMRRFPRPIPPDNDTATKNAR